MSVKIGQNEIGVGHPTYVIAEIGFNHCGDVELGKRMIESAAAAKVNAVKFQTFQAKELVLPSAGHYNDTQSAEMSFDDHVALCEIAREHHVDFLSTPFSLESVDLLEKVNVPAYKIASMDLNNHPLLDYVARTGKPMIVSTGMATMQEVAEARDVITGAGNQQIVFLHCLSCYPVLPADVNLKTIPYMQSVLDLPVGYSDHSIGNAIPLGAVALGASVIEKHYTVDKNLPGADNSMSADEADMSALMVGIRELNQALGSAVCSEARPDREFASAYRRSYFANVEIAEGTIIDESMLSCVRPASGLAPKYISHLIGRRAKQTIEQWQNVQLEALE